MANIFYDYIFEKFLTGQHSWRRDWYKAALIDTTFYTPDPAHRSMVDVSENAIVGYSAVFTGRTPTDGRAGANTLVFHGIRGRTVTGILVFAEKGERALNPLAAFWDTGVGLPLVTDGGDISLSWPSRDLFLI